MVLHNRLAIAVVVLCVVALAGCGGVLDDGEAEPDVDPANYDAETLQQETQAAMQDVDALRMEMHMEMEMDGESPFNSGSMSIDADGAANYETRRLHFEEFEVDLSTARGDQSGSGELYQVGDVQYMNVGNGWERQRADQNTWSQADAEAQAALLEDATVSIEGAEVVNGEDAIVLSVQPGDDALAAIAGQSAAMNDAPPGTMEIQSATVTQYVAAEEPHYLLRSDVEMTATIQGAEADVEVSMTMEDHDEAISIELPPELQ